MRETPENPYRGISEEERRRIGVREQGRELEVRSEEYARLFDRQVETLVERGYAEAAGMTQDKFRQLFATLKREARDLAATGPEIKEGHIPFVIVPSEKLLFLEKKIPLMVSESAPLRRSRPGSRPRLMKGFTGLSISELKTAEGLEIPESLAYLLVDVEDGKEKLRVSSDEAVKQFKKDGRSPLTAEEGVALITQYPEILKDHSMNLHGSRPGNDKVAGLRDSGAGPELVWNRVNDSVRIWGSASCGQRVGL